MERWQRYLVLSLAAFVASFALFSAGFALGKRDEGRILVTTGDVPGDGLGLVQEAFDRIMSTAVEPPDADALARGAIKGMVDVLRKTDDPYAFFYSPRGYRSLRELTTGRFSGIGVWLKVKDGALEIVSVLPSTPASGSGLQRGDTIEAIDGAAVGQMTTDEAVGLIKGREGTAVTLQISRDGETFDFTITRAKIDLPNLQARLTAEDLGYIRLLGFARNAGVQVRKEVQELIDEGAEGFVLDLRDNGGGLFSEAIEVASVFIEDGEIVTYRDNTNEDVVYDAEGEAFEDVPLVVLVNEGTASASEIVAGALKDRDRAVIIGTTTYGKGSVQEIIPLPDTSALKFTTAAYLTPDGDDINGEGIDPDVRVDASPDVQYQRAVDILKGIVLSESGARG
ncbi:MAG: S41 family peptidase [Actinomycetota bacterium]